VNERAAEVVYTLWRAVTARGLPRAGVDVEAVAHSVYASERSGGDRLRGSPNLETQRRS
jgi:hypothetical protein